jgi:murein DD-endopeptidase MepM/ murein hydrolase activator NlpD
LHLGQDYCVEASAEGDALRGTPVFGLGSGRVVSVRYREPAHRADGVGNFVVVDYGEGRIAAYLHLARVSVTPGETVDAASPLGEAGDVLLHPPPNCAHLHLELRTSGDAALNVPPNLRYGYASRDGTSRFSPPLGSNAACLSWIGARFADPGTLTAREAASGAPRLDVAVLWSAEAGR